MDEAASVVVVAMAEVVVLEVVEAVVEEVRLYIFCTSEAPNSFQFN